MVSKPHLNRLSVVRVAIRGDHRISHQLAGDRARELIPQGRTSNLIAELETTKSRQRRGERRIDQSGEMAKKEAGSGDFKNLADSGDRLIQHIFRLCADGWIHWADNSGK